MAVETLVSCTTRVVAFLGVILLLKVAGPEAAPLARIAGTSALIIVGALNAWSLVRPWIALRVLGWWACLAVLGTASVPEVQVIALALGTLAIAPRLGADAAIAAGVAACTFMLLSWVPWAYEACDQFASAISGLGITDDGPAGPRGRTAAGLQAAAITLVFVSFSGKKVRVGSLVGAIPLVAVAVVAQWWMADVWLNRLGPHAGHGHERPMFGALLPLTVVLGAIVAVAPSGQAESSTTQRKGRPSGLAIGVCFGLGVAFMLASNGWRPREPVAKKISFINQGGFDWNRPTHGKYGPFQGGMFGLLPIYLEEDGWTVHAVRPELVEQGALQDEQVIALINCQRIWSPEEADQLEHFMQKGGSLLVLGDHTNVFGSMVGFNSLLERWGVSFAFDSAYHAGGSWTDKCDWVSGLVPFVEDPNSWGIGIGASLELEYPARRVLGAKYAFSDVGHPENVMGAYLGDYTHQAEERLGDVVLVGGRRFGKGRLVVFGDTSGFQNGGMARRYHSVIAPLLNDLAEPSTVSVPAVLETLVVLFMGLVVLARLLAGTDSGMGLTGCMLAGIIAGSLVLERGHFGVARMAASTTASTVVVDESHWPDIGHYGVRWNSIGSLDTALHRADLRPTRRKDWALGNGKEPRAIVIVAPRTPVTSSEAQQADRFMRGGGTVLVAASGQASGHVETFLARYGVAISTSESGQVPPTHKQNRHEPRLWSASRLSVEPEVSASVLVAYGGTPFAAAVQVGEGWIVVIGDSRFFASGNVEGDWGFWPGNIRLIEDILQQYCGAKGAALADRFREPDKSGIDG